MIRNPRALTAVNTVGALAALFLLISWSLRPSTSALFPQWFLVALALVLLGSFVYQIVMTLTGRPVPVMRWARGLSDRQLWTIKGVVMAVLVLGAFIFVAVTVHRP